MRPDMSEDSTPASILARMRLDICTAELEVWLWLARAEAVDPRDGDEGVRTFGPFPTLDGTTATLSPQTSGTHCAGTGCLHLDTLRGGP
jgi:hypothetical protein